MSGLQRPVGRHGRALAELALHTGICALVTEQGQEHPSALRAWPWVISGQGLAWSLLLLSNGGSLKS